MGSGTTAGVALKHGRQYMGCELNLDYKEIQEARIKSIADKAVEVVDDGDAVTIVDNNLFIVED
jgi:DNA modification methylase